MTRKLADIQHDFAAMLRRTSSPGGRTGIYHNNRRANFCKALTLTYPVTARIVGEDFFARLSLDYLERHPSRCGDLHQVGNHFAGFLATGFAAPGSAFAYLADLAKLEWAWAEALLDADASPVSIEALAVFEPAAWPALRFDLHPSVALINSPWPILTIFDEHRREQPALVSLDADGECVVVLRRAQCVEAHRVTIPEPSLWEALASGQCLHEALESVLRRLDDTFVGDEFSLREALARLFAVGAVTRLRAA
ncbi:MAG: putative DNA-binding domain-containing protein [Nevskiaceae bacterium]